MSDIITCSKCGGNGKYIYKSGITGPCYQCNGSGKVKRTAHRSFAISINDENGKPFPWLHVNARSNAEAVRKARKICERGTYKSRIDTIIAKEDGISYSYKPL